MSLSTTSTRLLNPSPGATCSHFLPSYCLLPGRRDWSPPHYNLLSGSCRERYPNRSVTSDLCTT